MNYKLRCGRFIVLAVLGVAALGAVVMALWNWLIPSLFVGGRQIDYVQAMGVLLLSKILFGGFRGHGGHGRWHRQSLAQMAPEDRERFQSGMRGWCGKRKPDGSGTPEESHDLAR